MYPLLLALACWRGLSSNFASAGRWILSQIYCTGKISNEGKVPLYPSSLKLSTLFLLTYKVIDRSQKILYPWQVVGDGGSYILGGPTRLRTYYKSALRAIEASLLFFIFFSSSTKKRIQLKREFNL